MIAFGSLPRGLFIVQEQSLKEEIVSAQGIPRAAETDRLTEEACAGQGRLMGQERSEEGTGWPRRKGRDRG